MIQGKNMNNTRGPSRLRSGSLLSGFGLLSSGRAGPKKSLKQCNLAYTTPRT